MPLYELFLTVHILAAMAWIGCGFLLLVLTTRAAKETDGEELGRVIDSTADLGNKLFAPAALLTLAMGIALAIDGSWSLGQLWLALGLAGFAATFLTGMLVFKPRSDRIAEIRRREGRMTPEATLAARRMLVLGRLDYLVLVMVVFVMVVKPTGDDVALLATMGALLVAGVLSVTRAYRAVGAPA